jgi:hypothetical protein
LTRNNYISFKDLGASNRAQKIQNFLFVVHHESLTLKTLITRVADPHHINRDPDPAFRFNADPDIAPHQNDANLRLLARGPS